MAVKDTKRTLIPMTFLEHGWRQARREPLFIKPASGLFFNLVNTCGSNGTATVTEAVIPERQASL